MSMNKFNDTDSRSLGLFLFLVGISVIVTSIGIFGIIVLSRPTQTPHIGVDVPAITSQTSPAVTDAQGYGSQLPPENLKQEAIDPPASNFVTTGPRLGDLPIGKTVWIEPWTIWVASPGDGLPNKTFINGFHTYYESTRPNTIEITRDNDGWIANLHGSNQEWTAMKFTGCQGGGYDSQPVRFRR